MKPASSTNYNSNCEYSCSAASCRTWVEYSSIPSLVKFYSAIQLLIILFSFSPLFSSKGLFSSSY